MKKTIFAVLVVLFLCASAAFAADNTLTDKEKNGGWRLLFDGKTLNGWHFISKDGSFKVEDGTIAAVPSKSDTLATNEQFSNFILSVDFKEADKCNSGVFLRRPVRSTSGCRGIECQIYYQKSGTETGKHACGGIYDAVAPTQNVCKGPGVWQNMTIYCQDNTIRITMNGIQTAVMNLDEWKIAGRAPDGSKNKFTVAYKDMPRIGQIALQNHGTNVWFKNIKIKVLGKSGTAEALKKG